MVFRFGLCAVALLLAASYLLAFSVSSSEQPAGHPPQTPPDGDTVSTNPPSMIWRYDERAASYILEMSQDEDFGGDVIRVEDIDMPFYNHDATLSPGTWYWRYYVTTADAETSEPSVVKSFIVPEGAVELPVPTTEDLLASLPDHPRVYVTPDTLDEFRARRLGPAKRPWEAIKYSADSYVDTEPKMPELQDVPDDLPDTRKQVFYLKDGEPFVPQGYGWRDLNGDATRANVLSLAYLVSGDEKYAETARTYLNFIAPFRMDYHLEDRGQHDTVVYNYENGLKYAALTYDRIYDLLSEDEKQAILEHIEYHCDNAYKWTHDRGKLHLNYQNSHGQQCMHALCTTVMAIAGDSERADEWFDWLVRQYANRLAWGAEDGGYTEGQTYSHKYRMILDALLAIRTATGIDIFQKPRVRNSGDFWLYCMALNYWYNHWGDVYSLIMPMYGNNTEAVIANIIAARTDNRHLKWYSQETVADPSSQPYWYISETDLQPKPPVDIAQGRLFPDVGQLAAYDRFYDHTGNRIFFRSSPWGGHSHAHADQNGFIIHTGGEIMACDAGYYTHYGDDYHRHFSVTTMAHNSLLVNGEGQPKSITSKGEITGMFNTPTYCSFVGEAADAYAGKLDVFDRIIVFIRPDIFVCYDELEAPESSEFSWLFHSFEAADIDEDAREMVVKQQDQRLRVRHLAPGAITYEQSNERPYPMLTRKWCRFTDNCPQQYTIKANTAAAEQERILTLMDAYDVKEGSSVSDVEQFGDDNYTGLRFHRHGTTERVICQKRNPGRITADGDIETDARVTSVAQRDESVSRWMLYQGSRLQVDGNELFRATGTCQAALEGETPGAAAQIWLQCSEPLKAGVALDEEPQKVYVAPPNDPQAAKAMEVDYSAGRLRLELDEPGEVVVWVDPARNPSEPLADQQLLVRDERGTWTVDLERAYADNGEIVAFGELDPRQPGEFTVMAPGADILLQDQWDPEVSTRGTSRVTGTIREATEVFFRYGPGETPELKADITQAATGEIVNLLRNGGFEAGIPEYPPRSWTIGHGRDMAKTWPEWSHEDPYSGECHLKFVRPELYMVLRSQPMRLRTGGTYVLRFMARGNATEASVQVSGKMGTGARIDLEPSDEWREYRQEIEVKPGRTLITIVMGAGGEPDQVLYVDDMEFGYIAP